jgi:bacterioferritin
MRGNDKVLEHLSVALKAELTAINQYFLHAKMCENWAISDWANIIAESRSKKWCMPKGS